MHNGPFPVHAAKVIPSPIPFPVERSRAVAPARPEPDFSQLPETTDDVLAAFGTVSRRIKDLARELKCLGYFDDDGDHPRAA